MIVLLEHHGQEVAFIGLFPALLAVVLTLAGVLAGGTEELQLVGTLGRALLDSKDVGGRGQSGVRGGHIATHRGILSVGRLQDPMQPGGARQVLVAEGLLLPCKGAAALVLLQWVLRGVGRLGSLDPQQALPAEQVDLQELHALFWVLLGVYLLNGLLELPLSISHLFVALFQVKDTGL